MEFLETVLAARSAWLASQKTTFTVFDPHFGDGGLLSVFLKGVDSDISGHPVRAPDFQPPVAKLRYLASTEYGVVKLPQHFSFQPFASGLHFVDLPQFNAELHLWVGSLKGALQEFQGCFDAVLHADAPRQYTRRLFPSTIEEGEPDRVATVAVIGAGIAGSSVALALCKQGVQVHLHDSASGPAAGASGNWVGAFHPHITRGDSPLSKLTRLGFEHTVQALQSLTDLGYLVHGEDWATPGHLQTVPNHEAERVRETLEQLNFPKTLVRWAEPDELLPTPLGGLYFPQGGWVKPGRWVQANLQACGDLLNTHYNFSVTNLSSLREQHDAVVVCVAENSIDLAPVEGAKVGSVKGQISKLKARTTPAVVLSGESYAIAPGTADWMVLGATYERPVLDLNPTGQADEENMARFKAAFPDLPLGELIDHRCAVRSVWHDRLPAIGPVPNMASVFMSTGFASRGLLWAALGGWIVAGHCLGLPLRLKLLEKITPRSAPA